MSTSDLRADRPGGLRRQAAPVKAAVYAAMAILATAGIYGALSGAHAGLTLAAGIGVGILWVVATRDRGDGR